MSIRGEAFYLEPEPDISPRNRTSDLAVEHYQGRQPLVRVSSPAKCRSTGSESMGSVKERNRVHAARWTAQTLACGCVPHQHRRHVLLPHQRAGRVQPLHFLPAFSQGSWYSQDQPWNGSKDTERKVRGDRNLRPYAHRCTTVILPFHRVTSQAYGGLHPRASSHPGRSMR